MRSNGELCSKLEEIFREKNIMNCCKGDGSKLNVFCDLIATKDESVQREIDEIFSSEHDVVWYPGSADDLFPCYMLEQYKQSEVKDRYVYFFTDIEDQFGVSVFKRKCEEERFSYNIQANGRTNIQDSIGEILCISRVEPIQICGLNGETLVDGFWLTVCINEKSIPVFYLRMDLHVFLFEFVGKLDLKITWMFYKDMNLNFGYDTPFDMFKRWNVQWPQYVVANRFGEMDRLYHQLWGAEPISCMQWEKAYYNCESGIHDALKLYRTIQEERRERKFDMPYAESLEEFFRGPEVLVDRSINRICWMYEYHEREKFIQNSENAKTNLNVSADNPLNI